MTVGILAVAPYHTAHLTCKTQEMENLTTRAKAVCLRGGCFTHRSLVRQKACYPQIVPTEGLRTPPCSSSPLPTSPDLGESRLP